MTDRPPIEEHRIELSQYDLDHLNDGQPVFKPVGESTQIVLYSDAPLESDGSGADGFDGVTEAAFPSGLQLAGLVLAVVGLFIYNRFRNAIRKVTRLVTTASNHVE